MLELATLIACCPIPETGNRLRSLLEWQAFVNTVDVENGIEELTDPGSLYDVLTRIGALDPGAPPLSRADLPRARRCERRSATCSTSTSGSPPITPRSSCSIARARPAASVRFAGDGIAPDRRRATLDGGLGRILAVVYAAMVAAMDATEGLSARGLRLDLLRPLAQLVVPLVRDVGLRQPDEDQALPDAGGAQ